MDEELVSIIIPFHNAKKYIEDCLKCVKEQHYKKIEAIFVDDGSDDYTADVIRQSGDIRIKVISITKSGVSAARNIGIENASGKYITFWDVDDIPHPDFISTLVDDIQENEVDTIICNYDDVFIGDRHVKITLPWENEIIGHEEIENVLIPRMIYPLNGEGEIRGLVWRTFTHTEFIRENEIFFDQDVVCAEDLLFTMELYHRSKNIYVEGNSLYDYKRNSTSTMNTYTEDHLEKDVAFHKKLAAQLKKLGIYENNRGRYEANRLSMYTTSISNCVRNGTVHEGTLTDMQRMHEMLKKDKINIMHSKAPLKIRVSAALLQMKMYRVLVAIYALKERRRVAKYN